MLGAFAQDYAITGQNRLVSLSSEDMSKGDFWLYMLFFYIPAFLWTTVLDYLVNTSSKEFLTDETKRHWKFVEDLGMVLSVFTMAACLLLSFLYANSYKNDSTIMINWLVAFAVSLIKDVLLGFHIKGIFCVIVCKNVLPGICRFCCRR